MLAPPRLELQSITKRYPTTVANDGISLAVQPGEIHAVLGENGAGKSTLMKIIYGVVQPDAGQILFDGKPVHVRNPHEARALGIAMVFQHFSLFDSFTVAENVWLGLDKGLTLKDVTQRIAATAAHYGLEIQPARPVHSLSVGERQRVEIIRALLGQPKLLILDEPTSVLTPQAVEKLFVVLRQLAEQGCSILYISHKLHEIRALCSACTVVRDGRVTGECDPRVESDATLARLMIGSEPPALPHHARTAQEEVLRTQGLSLPRLDAFGVDLVDVDFHVCAGEIVGIAGISGNGQQELLRALSGEDTRAAPNMVQLSGQAAAHLAPRERRALCLHFVPEERLGRGMVPSMSLAHNLLLTRAGAFSGRGGWLHMRRLQAEARAIMERFGVKAAGPMAAASSLSGGNLQKFMVGREVTAQPKLLLVSQPTWGVDVGAAARIHSALLALRDAGCAIVVVSEELEELFALSDRLYVLARGQLSPSVPRAKASMEGIGRWLGGQWHTEGQEAPHAAA